MDLTYSKIVAQHEFTKWEPKQRIVTIVFSKSTQG